MKSVMMQYHITTDIQVLSFVFLAVAMSSLLDSEAALRERALEFGLTSDECRALETKGLTTLNKVAYALTTPGINPSDAALKSLLDSESPDAVSVGSLASLRQLMFEAQTMCMQSIRNKVENVDSNKRPELAHAERHARILKQKVSLAGYDLTGPLECSHGSYDLVGEMLAKDSVTYLSPSKFGTRASEVARDKPQKEVVVGTSSQLTVTSATKDDKCNIHTDLLLSQAFTRRALACDLMGAVTFQKMESWHRFLFSHLDRPPLSGYSPVSLEQIIRADKQAWIRLAELVPSMKRTITGELPLDDALPNLRNDPSVVMLLLPLPSLKQSSAHSKSNQPAVKRPSEVASGENSKTKFKKGKGAGKSKSKKGGGVPEELKNLKSNTSSGERICWNYNLSGQKCTFASNGGTCKRGRHVCMKCEGDHPQYEHEMA